MTQKQQAVTTTASLMNKNSTTTKIKLFSSTLLFLTILLLFFLIVSCRNSEKSKYRTLNINEAISRKTEVKLSEIAQSVEWIKLETKGSPFIGIISKVVEAENYLLILGKEGVGNKDMIHIFDMNGKFVRTLGEFGKGPCEYMQVSDIYYDSVEQKIFILSENNKYLIEFDIEGNCFEGSIETMGAMNFSYYNDCFFMHRSSNMMYFEGNNSFNQLVIQDFSKNITYKVHPAPLIKSSYLNPFIEEADFVQYKGELLYYISLDDTVYKLSPENEKPYLVFDHGNQSFPADYKWDLEGRNNATRLKMSKVTNITCAGNLIFLNYRYAEETGLLMLKGQNLYNCMGGSSHGLLDDVDGLENITSFTSCGDYIYQFFEPYKLLDATPNSFGFSDAFKEIVAGLHENSNIVIRRIRIQDESQE
jgi:hypothetical protein